MNVLEWPPWAFLWTSDYKPANLTKLFFFTSVSFLLLPLFMPHILTTKLLCSFYTTDVSLVTSTSNLRMSLAVWHVSAMDIPQCAHQHQVMHYHILKTSLIMVSVKLYFHISNPLSKSCYRHCISLSVICE